MSTFHGLEMARQALFAQQSALYTTGHNISNANTEGYSRQRVNFATMPAYPSPGRNRPDFPGQMGTGVQIGSIQRIRDDFLDKQFRTESNRAGYWDTRSAALSRVEELLNEPSNSGLSKTMDEFWESLQDLGVEPNNSGARSVVAQRGLALSETFNYLAGTLTSMRTDLKEEIDVTIKNTNSLLSQINKINEQIKKIEPHGHLSNDLYDERDRLIDELSGIINIEVEYKKTGGNPSEIAKGIATIKMVAGTDSITLVDGDTGNYNELEVETNDGEETYEVVTGLTVGESKEKIDVEQLMNSNGSLEGLIEAYGYEDKDKDQGYSGEYLKIMDELDKMAFEFATAFNDIHSEGFDLNGKQSEENFFEIGSKAGAAGLITVNEKILDEPSLIAASTEDPADSGEGTIGNGKNAVKLAEMMDGIKDEEEIYSIRSEFQSFIGELGVQAKDANRMSKNTDVLRSQVNERRLSVSAVSLDEEMSNMIQFQHSYNAAARSMTTIDEMLDRIINNMGLVGR